jgi:tRNA (cytidine/uridine-2'-O-)-methyltransferase
MDYVSTAKIIRHASWEDFKESIPCQRRILLTPHSQNSFYEFNFTSEDLLIFGRESCGVPDHVALDCITHLSIPMEPQKRSLNLALSAAIVAGEVHRQVLTKYE